MSSHLSGNVLTPPSYPTTQQPAGLSDYQQLLAELANGTAPPSTVDSIASLSASDVSQALNSAVNGQQPTLPAATSQSYNALQMIATAFAAIFLSMQDSAESSVTQLNQDQQLNNIQAQVVLQSTNLAVQDQLNAYQAYQQAEAEANNPLMQILSYVFIAVMAVVIIATIISSFFQGPAAAVEVEGEVAATSAGSSAIAGGESAAATTAAETTSNAAAQTANSTASSVSTSSSAGETTSAADTGATTAADEATSSTVDDVAASGAGEGGGTGGTSTLTLAGVTEDETATDTLTLDGATTDESSTEAASGAAAKQGLSRGLRALIVLIASVVGATPSLAQGIMSLGLQSVYQTVANLQNVTGQATANQSYQESMYQFLQNASTQTTSVANQEASASVDNIRAVDSIFATYQQITAQTKRAVV